MRSRQLVTLLLLVTFVLISLYYMRHPTLDDLPTSSNPAKGGNQPLPETPQRPREKDASAPEGQAEKPLAESPKDSAGTPPAEKPAQPPVEKPAQPAAGQQSGSDAPHQDPPEASLPVPPSTHPVDKLVMNSGTELEKMLKRQSKTLQEAVTEYKRRYKMHPPPNFDKWYEFATKRGVTLIDEFDTIYDSLLPFWGLSPATLRERVKESLGFDNAMMGFAIRGGKFTAVEGASQWQQMATKGMMKDFVQFLPDMDIAFNVHDEPRVVIPHDDLARLVQRAKDQILPESFKNAAPKNEWTVAKDIGDGEVFEEERFTRFNVFAHQPTWSHSRQSCSSQSPARSLDEVTPDDSHEWATDDGLFVRNKTAFSDICNTPSLKDTFGFFNRPNALAIVQDLFPVFSQSKVSSFQDILYPSPWYWSDKVPYKSSQDYAWKDKQDKLYWRGSTTGGFSRNGGWRKQHRQQVVGYVNKADDTTVFTSSGSGETATWSAKKEPKSSLKDLFDVYFSHVGQCDPGDCDAQKEYFEIASPAKQYDAWKYKYLLDLDGNAFSGRFYAFLRSRSMVFKMAVFREWHEEWIKPWVHYVPLSLSGKEYFETVRYFDREARGKLQALGIAEGGKEWAMKVLRNEDLEAWFFRLLLEYGRVMDDNRHVLGYAVPQAAQGQTQAR